MDRYALAFLVLSVAGTGVADYTAYEYITQDFTSCTINQQFSCGGVFQSGHTSIFGIQFYILGLVWFPLLLVVGLYTSRMAKRPVNAEILLPILMTGNIFTIYLWYLELAIIHVICPLCVSNYAVNYALTIIVVISFLKEPGADSSSENPTVGSSSVAKAAHVRPPSPALSILRRLEIGTVR